MAANSSHTILGKYANGRVSTLDTTGNKFAHIILRGGKDSPNFDEQSIKQAVKKIKSKNEATGLHIPEGVLVDASHKNKVEGHQRPAVEEIARQLELGSTAIFGVMIESNIKAGTQTLNPACPQNLEYGVSITDECIDLSETTALIELLARAVRKRRNLAKTSA